MPLKKTTNQESNDKLKSKTYFFSSSTDVNPCASNLKKQQKMCKHKVVKYSTVFKVDKENLKVSDDEIVISKQNLTTQTLKEAKEKVGEQKKHKTKWLNLAFFIFNLVILAGVLIYQSNTFGVASLDALKQNTRYSFLIYALLLFFIIMAVETFRTHILVYNTTKRFRPFLCYKASAICRYYDCITPFATGGGQPFEIFYLNSRGINGGIATSVPLTKSIFNAIAFILVSTFVLIAGSHLLGSNQKVIITWGVITLIISFVVLFILFLFAVSRKIMPKILMFILKLGKRMKLVKDYRLLFNKYMRTILEYQKSTKFFITNFWLTIISIICSAVIILLRALIPLMLFCAFNEVISTSIMLEILSKIILVDLVTRYIPLPGGSGVAEISFSALFISLFAGGTLFWAMLFWRFLTYFMYLLQGIIVIIYDFAYGNKKNRLRLIKIKKEETEIMSRTKGLGKSAK